MEIWLNFGWLALGLVLLYFGADWLVKGSSGIALRAGISPLIVGLTVVAFGTSAPELLVSMQANLKSPPQGDIALGNVVGSNICNIALVLAIASLVRPIKTNLQVVKRELPILLAASLALGAMLWDGTVQRWEGAILAAGIVIYVVTNVRLAKREAPAAATPGEENHAPLKCGSCRAAMDVGLVVLGLATLVIGADRLVFSGTSIAREFGVSEALIALTLLACGTSLPELATSIVAILKNEGDMITGNAVGSCIFNILAVVGITACIAPLSASKLNNVDLWVMIGVSAVVLPAFMTGRVMARWEGALLLAGYVGYCGYLVQRG